MRCDRAKRAVQSPGPGEPVAWGPLTQGWPAPGAGAEAAFLWAACWGLSAQGLLRRAQGWHTHPQLSRAHIHSHYDD